MGLKQLITVNDGLRYSLVPLKYTERWGINEQEIHRSLKKLSRKVSRLKVILR